MARQYPLSNVLSQEIEARRRARTLGYRKLGELAGVDSAQVYRICQGEFTTLSPSVVSICRVLGVDPEAEEISIRSYCHSELHAMLRDELDKTWDGSSSHAIVIRRVLRALNGIYLK